MKKIFASFCLTLFIALSAVSQQTYVTTTTLNIRDTSNAQGHIVSSIPGGTSVQAISQNNGWIKIRYKTATGYINLKYVQSADGNIQETKSYTNPPKSTVHYYTNVDGNSVQAPTKYDQAPAGASAKCRDGSYSFSQHARGTCSHHGGVAQWLH